MACPTPFLDASLFSDGGYIDGRLCQTLDVTNGTISCCLPCPMTDWTYPDTFVQVGIAAQWTSVFSMVCCVFLLLSWACLPIDKTHRHYLSICLVLAVVFMNLGFVIPLAGQPDQCYDSITPNDMQTSSVCAASGTFLILGGWAGVLWVFLRSLSLHLQICWQVVVGRNFMWFSQATGWGIPAIGIVLALTLSGVSFRFGTTCHINHDNSLADLWIPLLVFAGLTIIIQFATFGYCIKVYLASLADNNATTENSGLPSYTNSIRTMTPRQAYRRVRRVIQLQWRGIAIVLIIICDVVFFAIVFVFEDNTEETIKNNPNTAEAWIGCLAISNGNKTACLSDASEFVVNMPTIGAVLILLSMNGLWLVLLLGRWSMVTGWIELITRRPLTAKREFVSVDALGGPYDLKMNTDPLREGPVYPPLRNYLASTDATSPADDMISTPPAGYTGGRRTPDYFGRTARYQPPTKSFSSPRPPTREGQSSPASWEHAAPGYPSSGRPYSPPTSYHYQQNSYSQSDSMNPLQMNRI